MSGASSTRIAGAATPPDPGAGIERVSARRRRRRHRSRRRRGSAGVISTGTLGAQTVLLAKRMSPGRASAAPKTTAAARPSRRRRADIGRRDATGFRRAKAKPRVGGNSAWPAAGVSVRGQERSRASQTWAILCDSARRQGSRRAREAAILGLVSPAVALFLPGWPPTAAQRARAHLRVPETSAAGRLRPPRAIRLPAIRSRSSAVLSISGGRRGALSRRSAR